MASFTTQRYYDRKKEKTMGHESEKFNDEIPWRNELREIPSLNKSALLDMYSSNKSIFRISVGLLFLTNYRRIFQ